MDNGYASLLVPKSDLYRCDGKWKPPDHCRKLPRTIHNQRTVSCVPMQYARGRKQNLHSEKATKKPNPLAKHIVCTCGRALCWHKDKKTGEELFYCRYCRAHKENGKNLKVPAATIYKNVMDALELEHLEEEKLAAAIQQGAGKKAIEVVRAERSVQMKSVLAELNMEQFRRVPLYESYMANEITEEQYHAELMDYEEAHRKLNEQLTAIMEDTLVWERALSLRCCSRNWKKQKCLRQSMGGFLLRMKKKKESMETQIALVQDYINRSRELSYVDTYFDNGFTGTNFKRPAFTRLMNDVRQKKIKCIVVKDLSRFGRNYLEAGYYIETVFPFLGIRLIAVTDNFDSTRKEDMESLALSIRNMVNAMYAKDISKKMWTSLQRKKEAGYAVGNDAPYGYIRNPVTKRNEIDPEAAFYVQLIFQWETDGCTYF